MLKFSFFSGKVKYICFTNIGMECLFRGLWLVSWRCEFRNLIGLTHLNKKSQKPLKSSYISKCFWDFSWDGRVQSNFWLHSANLPVKVLWINTPKAYVQRIWFFSLLLHLREILVSGKLAYTHFRNLKKVFSVINKIQIIGNLLLIRKLRLWEDQLIVTLHLPV